MPRAAVAHLRSRPAPEPQAAPAAEAFCPGALMRGRRGALLDSWNGGGAVVLGRRCAIVEAAATASAGRDAARLHNQARAVLAREAPGAEALALGAEGAAVMAAARRGACAASGRAAVIALADFAPAALVARLGQGDVAAVVADPLGLGEAAGERLRGARAACYRAGSALLIDERLAAPRWAAGGAQGLFKVIADLAVYGPALTNGHRFAALAGRRDLVAAARHFTPDAFAPTPQGMAAVAAAALVLDHAPVRAVLQVRGSELAAELERVLAETGAAAWVRVAGDPVALRLQIDHPRVAPAVLHRRLAREMRARGVLLRGAVCVSYAWGDAEVSAFVEAAAGAFAALARSLRARPRLAAVA